MKIIQVITCCFALLYFSPSLGFWQGLAAPPGFADGQERRARLEEQRSRLDAIARQEKLRRQILRQELPSIQGIIDTREDALRYNEPLVETDGTPAGDQNAEGYQSTPSRMGLRLRQLLQRREYFLMTARAARNAGDAEMFQTYYGKLQAMDKDLYYKNGMKAIEDLFWGNAARASLAWSKHVGRDIRIAPRTDGMFNIKIDGGLWGAVSKEQLSVHLREMFE